MGYVEPLTLADLNGLKMTATAHANGDEVRLVTTSGKSGSYQAPTSVLGLSSAWTEAEFNIFGDCCGTETSFTSPTVLVVKNSIDDTSIAIPACIANDGTTLETNNAASFVPTAAPVCCRYGGASPAIEFEEVYDTSGHPHSASCGPTQIEGDPHIKTTDGTKYDFQGAGEFVSLRDPDGMEIQTRQTAIATTFFPPPDPHDGLASCVSINTAVAARIGDHRVTWELSLIHI